MYTRNEVKEALMEHIDAVNACNKAAKHLHSCEVKMKAVGLNTEKSLQSMGEASPWELMAALVEMATASVAYSYAMDRKMTKAFSFMNARASNKFLRDDKKLDDELSELMDKYYNSEIGADDA